MYINAHKCWNGSNCDHATQCDVAGSRSTLCNKDVGPITLQPLYDVIVTLVIYTRIGLQYNVWLGHDTISTKGSPVVKGLINKIFVDVSALLVIIQPTYIALVLLYGYY